MEAEAPGSVPDLQNRVRVDAHLMFHWNAFWDLGKDRAFGFGVGPIPWSAIDRYAQRHQIDDPDEFDRFNLLLSAMDREFTAWQNRDRRRG